MTLNDLFGSYWNDSIFDTDTMLKDLFDALDKAKKEREQAENNAEKLEEKKKEAPKAADTSSKTIKIDKCNSPVFSEPVALKKDVDDIFARYDILNKRVDNLFANLNKLAASVENQQDSISKILDVLEKVTQRIKDLESSELNELLDAAEPKCNCDECHGDCRGCGCNEDDDCDSYFNSHCNIDEEETPWGDDSEDEADDEEPIDTVDSEADDIIADATSAVLGFLHCELDNLKEKGKDLEKDLLAAKMCSYEEMAILRDIDENQRKIKYLKSLIAREEKSF